MSQQSNEIEYYAEMANEFHDDGSMGNTQAIVLARAKMVEEGADPTVIRAAMLKSRFVGDERLNLRATLELFG